MAFTFTNVTKTVFGNQVVQTGLLTTDAVSGVISFGLGVLTGIHVTEQSATTNNSAVATRFRLNAVAGGTASNGDLGVSGAVAGNEYWITVFGR